MSHGTMQGMFWGGVVMALTPVVLGIVLAIHIFREQRAARRAREGRGAVE